MALKTINDYLKSSENPYGEFQKYDEQKLRKMMKQFGDDIINHVQAKWSPVCVPHDTGVRWYTWEGRPYENLELQGDTFNNLKQDVK